MKHLKQDLSEKIFKLLIVCVIFTMGFLFGSNYYLREKIETRFMLRTCVELNNDAVTRLAACVSPLPKRH
jgi:hypothetical protein